MLRSWEEVKRFLKDRIDSEQESQFEVIARAKLSRDSYYKLFSHDRLSSPMRKSTVVGLANALGFSVEYEDGIPQFKDQDAGFDTVSATYARDALRHAIQVAGNVETLARKSHTTVEILNSILNPSNYDSEVPMKLFANIANAIGMTLVIFLNGKIEFHPEDGEWFNENRPNLKPQWEIDEEKFAERDEFSGEIPDPGLQQLLSPENRRKHGISDDEAQDLMNLAFRRKSMTTLSQWVSILYTLRDLDKS